MSLAQPANVKVGSHFTAIKLQLRLGSLTQTDFGHPKEPNVASNHGVLKQNKIVSLPFEYLG
jgi:hypothetical protein